MKRLSLIFVAVAVLLTSFTALVGLGDAQSNGLGITPRRDYVVKPGETIKDNLFIGNLSKDQNLKLSAKVVDFKAQDETGAPALELREKVDPTSWSIRPFVSVPESVDIEAGKSIQLPISITIPPNQGAGSYYSAIKYEVTSSAGGSVNLLASSATLVFVKVPGETKQLLKLQQLGAYVSKNETQGSFKKLFSSKPPKEFAFRLKNEGNIAEQPAGSAVIKNTFGKTVKQVDQINPHNSLILIGQTRKFITCIETEKTKIKDESGKEVDSETCKPIKLAPGRYKIELSTLYGENGTNTREINAKAVFWYLPAWFIILILAVVLVVGGGGYYTYNKQSHRFKKHKK
ncbi:MAG: hypothetical protein AAB423_02345 [Patescibacteria group bacterium]